MGLDNGTFVYEKVIVVITLESGIKLRQRSNELLLLWHHTFDRSALQDLKLKSKMEDQLKINIVFLDCLRVESRINTVGTPMLIFPQRFVLRTIYFSNIVSQGNLNMAPL